MLVNAPLQCQIANKRYFLVLLLFFFFLLGCDFLSASLVCLSVMHSHTFPDISAIVNGPLSLPCTCSGEEVEWTIFSPIKATIAGCHHGVCEIDPSFNKSFSFLGNTSSGNFSISINSTRYNDHGMYRCTCNGEEVSAGKLHVYGKSI